MCVSMCPEKTKVFPIPYVQKILFTAMDRDGKKRVALI